MTMLDAAILCRLWNTVKASMIHSIHTGSQVSGLAWSHTVNELLSIHGYATSALHIWKAPSLVNAATLTGHNSRVLFLAMSPDGQTAATGAGKSPSHVCAAQAKLLNASAMICSTDVQEMRLSDSGECFQRTQQNQPQQNL